MSAHAVLALAAAAFVGSHFMLSHPLRAPLAERLGEKAFSGLYSLVAAAMLAWMLWAKSAIGAEVPRWIAGDALWLLASGLMWFGSILLVGSFSRNPALPGAMRRTGPVARPHGVFRLTRHPMMWGIALWAVTHMLVNPRPASLILTAAMLILALGGAAAQDAKKSRMIGTPWRDWRAMTSFLPFGRGLAFVGWGPILGGTALFVAATYAHQALGGMAAGPWRWL